VEIYFEPYCVDPRSYGGEQHAREAVVSDWGIVGGRGEFSSSTTFYNHMHASAVRDLLGPEIWASYFKFCVIRNPYDKVVSYFWHDLDAARREVHRCAYFGSVRQAFAEWTKLERFPDDAFIYTLDGVAAVDDFIRYEQLAEDTERLCGRLKIPWQPSRL